MPGFVFFGGHICPHLATKKGGRTFFGGNNPPMSPYFKEKTKVEISMFRP